MLKNAAVELRGITKRFGTVLANEDINLRVAEGTIHGIVGENGAGKSTAMNLLYGMYRPDEGHIFVEGLECRWRSSADAIARGIGMVHQHFMLAGSHTALDNILLSAGPARFGWMDRKLGREQLMGLGKRYGLAVELERPVEELPVGIQQRVEILKLLYRDAQILILDEPTAVLTPQETTELFGNLRKLRDEGKTILLITHKLREVMSFTDRVTVFRGGKVAGEVETAQANPQMLADMMVGRKVNLRIEVTAATPSPAAALEVTGLSFRQRGGGRHTLSDINFSVKRGEIVGIAGVEGNGQTELMQALLHPDEQQCRSAGRISVLGRDVSNWPTRAIRELGVATIPEDRHQQALLLERPLDENFLLGLQRDKEFRSGMFLAEARIRGAAARAIEEYDVRPANLEMRAGQLSGGNQQKFVAAREFHRKPMLLLAAQPTRGVDVGAIEFIHRRIVRARDEGAGVLLISSELDEILGLSDRILVLYEGRLAGEFSRGKVTESDLGLRMGGA